MPFLLKGGVAIQSEEGENRVNDFKTVFYAARKKTKLPELF